MADQFSNWDRFQANRLLTNDPRKALAWTRREMLLNDQRLERLRLKATLLALESSLRADGKA